MAQRPYRLRDMEWVLRHVRPDLDTYMSQAFFARPCRRSVHVAWLTHAYVDLDLYKLPIPPQPGVAGIWLRTFCADEGIPEPSLIVFSGRGIYCKWCWSSPDTPSRRWPGRGGQPSLGLSWRFEEWGADPRAVDVSRILRVVGTTNSKSGMAAETLWQAERNGDVLTYDFELFADEVLKNTMEEIRGFREQARLRAEEHQREAEHQGARHTSRRPFIAEDWCCGILEDLRTLATLRWGGIVQPGYRATFAHVGACCLAHYTSPDQLWHEISAGGRLLVPPDYTNSERFRRECSTLLLAAQRALVAAPTPIAARQVTPIYTYRASTLVERLQITPNEERQMTRLISDGEKYRRISGATRCRHDRAGRVAHREHDRARPTMACRRRQPRNLVSPPYRETGLSYFYYCVAPEGKGAEFLPAGGLSLCHLRTNGRGFCLVRTRASQPSATLSAAGNFRRNAGRVELAWRNDVQRRTDPDPDHLPHSTSGSAGTRPNLRPRPGARSVAAGSGTRRRVGGDLGAAIPRKRPVFPWHTRRRATICPCDATDGVGADLDGVSLRVACD